jgi:ADP-ribosyl-[dinitrogen reductase] hydrolase
MSNLNRAIGSLVGLAVGDAVGATNEFQSRATLTPISDMVGGGPFNLKAGQWTDDTSMALCLAESMITSYDEFNADATLMLWCQWMNQGHHSVKGYCFDIGHTTQTALDHFSQHGNPISSLENPAQSNGSIMRLAPVVLASSDLTTAGSLGQRQGALTHPHPNCIRACFFLARCLYRAIHGDSEPWCELVEYGLLNPNQSMRNWFQFLGQTDQDQIPSTGYVLDTMKAALWALAGSDNFEHGLLKAVNLGGDSDTVGAVYGQIAGAYYGLDGIPEKWVARLHMSSAIQKMARQCYQLNFIE